MRITFGGCVIEVAQEPAYEDLMGLIRVCSRGHVVFGDEGRHADKFWRLTTLFDWAQSEAFGIGVCTERQSVQPNLLVPKSLDVLILGFNHEIVGVDVFKGSVRWRLPIDSFFRWFYELPERSAVLAFHEIGVLAVNASAGDIRWQYSKDIIVSVAIDGHSVSLGFLDEGAVRLSLDDGRVL